MPAPEITHVSRSQEIRPTLGHVNLMVDTFIANVDPDDLRAIVRSLLATGPPALASAFISAARTQLRQTHVKVSPPLLFTRRPSDGTVLPTSQLTETLGRARSLFGAGMGLASLGVLASVVRASRGLTWSADSEMADALALVDADICQALQSAREELQDGISIETPSACEAIADMRSAINCSVEDIEEWGGEFPLERAAASMKCWTL